MKGIGPQDVRYHIRRVARGRTEGLGRWFQRVENGAEVLMGQWHIVDKKPAVERQRTVSIVTLAADTSTGAP